MRPAPSAPGDTPPLPLPPLRPEPPKIDKIDMADALIAQVRERAWKGQPLPTMSQVVPPEVTGWNPESLAQAASRADEVLQQQQQQRAGNQGNLSTTSLSNQMSRSKRKIAFTLSGPVVGFGLGVAGAAVGAAILATGPIGVGVVVGAAIAAVVGAAIGYLFRKGWRNARAAYYAGKYVVKGEGGFVFSNTKDALNGVRYVIQKRDLSRISDDIKELNAAIRDFERREREGVDCCQNAAELVYKYHRVHLLITPIEEHLQLFKQFYDYVRTELQGALHGTGKYARGHCLSDRNILKALRTAHARANDIHHNSSWCLEPPAGIPKACYKQDSSGKPIKPVITVFRGLSEEERRPFVRLANDAWYMSEHGEYAFKKSYEDKREDIKALFPGIDVGVLFGPPGTPVDMEADAAWRSRLASDVESGDFSSGEEPDYGTEMGKGAGITLGKQLGVSKPVGVGLTVAKTAIQGQMQDVGTNLASSGIGGGFTLIGSVAMSIAQAAVNAKNLKNEMKAVSEEYGKSLDEMNVDRMLTGLRTILKDGKVFEKCIDEAAKMLEYQREFSRAMRLSEQSGGMTCGVAFELVYRVLKSYKHFVRLTAYMPFLKEFAGISSAILDKAKELDRAEDSRVNSVVRRWIETGDHQKCKNKGLCYGGMDLL